jgi:hypothetical protein
VTTILLLLLVNLGVMSLGIGILGEYIAKIYAESKRRPLWFVDYTLNFESNEAVRGLAGSDGPLKGPSVEPRHESFAA